MMAGTKGKVRVDISLRQESVDTKRELITSEYDDLRPFVARVLSPEHLLAEKVRALLVRGKARDVYDIWLLVNQGVVMNRELVERKLKLYDMTVSRLALEAALSKAQSDWERDPRTSAGTMLPLSLHKCGKRYCDRNKAGSARGYQLGALVKKISRGRWLTKVFGVS
jgi:predicted nucleotidyltransferase component of viral defense system